MMIVDNHVREPPGSRQNAGAVSMAAQVLGTRLFKCSWMVGLTSYPEIVDWLGDPECILRSGWWVGGSEILYS